MGNNLVIVFSKSDLLWNRFPNINDKSSDEEIIREIGAYYLKGGGNVDVSIDDNIITVVLSQNSVLSDFDIGQISKLAQKGEFKRARKKIEDLLKEYPHESELYRFYGQTLSDEGRLDEAEKRLIDCLKYNPDNTRGLVMLGNIYNQQGKKDLAKTLYKRAIEHNDKDIYALSNYGSLCIELEDFIEARKVLEIALEIDSEYWVTNYSLSIVNYNDKKYLEAFNFAIKARENIDKRDPRTQLIMKILINISKAQDDNLVIEDLYIPFKDELEKELGKKIIFRRDDGIKSVARIKIAEYYGTNEHIVLFNPNNFGYKYSIMHELTHLKMISEARKIGKNKVITSSYDKKQKLVKELERNATYLQKQFEAQFESYSIEILQQVYNSPLDLCVENYLFNKYEGLRPSQFLFQMQMILSAIDVAQNNDLKQRVPELIYNSNVTMNSIMAQQIKDLYGIDKTSEFGHNDLVRLGKKLYDKFESKKDSMGPGDEYELVDIWAEKLGFGEYFDTENDNGDFKKGIHITDNSEQYSEEMIHARINELGIYPGDADITIIKYCLSAIRFFKNKSQKEIERIGYELAIKGTNGIKYGEDSKYRINSIPGKEFSGYEFLSYMYVAWQILKPEADLGLDYGKEYELAKQLDAE